MTFMTDMFTMLTPMLNLRFGLTYKYAIHLPLLGYTRYLRSLVYKAILCIVDR